MRRYGYDFPTDDPVVVELMAIRAGGRWLDKRKRECGAGLFAHHKALQSMIAPWKRWDRWSELLLREFIENRMTVVVGPKNSAKTHSASFFALDCYLADPEHTTVLMSSTDSRSLELRIWGEFKKLWSAARSISLAVSGRMIESRQMVVTDTDAEATDFRSGCVGIPCVVGGTFVGIGKFCFREGTLIDTPEGKRPIESLQVGDGVLSAAGPSTVTATASRLVDELVRLHFNDGSTVDCTPDHPFLTSSGWVNALDILPSHHLCTVHETMQSMWGSPPSLRETLLQRILQTRAVGEAMQKLRKAVHPFRSTRDFLHALLRIELEDAAARDRREDDCCERLRDSWPAHQRGHREEPRGARTPPVTALEELANDDRQPKAWGESTRHVGLGRCSGNSLSRSGAQLQGQDWLVIQVAASRPALPAGLCMAGNPFGCGSRWLLPSLRAAIEQGQDSRSVPQGKRVDRVEVLEPASGAVTGQSQSGYRVYNLQVADHPSYSVNGVVVHNCGIKNRHIIVVADELSFMSLAFYDAIANLAGNEGFKGIGLGNPKDQTDTLGKLAEPSASVGGWEGIEDTGKTRWWPTKMQNGKCICLDGRDTPNNDEPRNQWPHLIRQARIDDDIAMFGSDSWQVSAMDYGVFPKDAQARRVLTRTICEKGRALEEVTWETPPTRIAGLDAAYGATGGDRCVLVEGAFGRCVDGVSRIAFARTPLVVPVKAGLPAPPEDQIADYVREYCEEREIEPAHVGFDSTGRGTLVSSFGRLWSTEVIPVEFGGAASEVMVSERIQVICRKYYANFMSELWYRFRELIEAGQLRQLPTTVMEEMCLRGWERSKGNRIVVEAKADMKERAGRSPDLGDAAVVMLEVARRLGFEIAIGGKGKAANLRWLDEDLERVRKLRQTYALSGATSRLTASVGRT